MKEECRRVAVAFIVNCDGSGSFRRAEERSGAEWSEAEEAKVGGSAIKIS